MNKPTREQWRGYIWLCAALFAALLVLILRPRHHSVPPTTDHSQLQELVAQYGDSMNRESEQERQWYREQYRRRRPDFGYDTTYRHSRRYSDSAQYQRREVCIELNSADTTELQRLYGIGPSFARRIVKYRSLLGGYVRKEQLREVYGMTEERYQAVVPHVTVDMASVKQLDINGATLQELRRHPYLDYYQAKAIVAWRDKGNHIGSMQDLLKVNLIDDSTIIRLDGYLLFR